MTKRPTKCEAAQLVYVEAHADSGYWLRVKAHEAMPPTFRHLNYFHCRRRSEADTLCRAIRAHITRTTAPREG